MDTAIEHSLSDHPKSPSFMDSSFSSYEPFGHVDYLNGGYPPNSPFGISSIGRKSQPLLRILSLTSHQLTTQVHQVSQR